MILPFEAEYKVEASRSYGKVREVVTTDIPQM